MTAILISSQRHRDEEIVAEKRENADYGVSVSPAFQIEGQDYRLILDGHHSWDAAILDGVEPLICELDATDDDRIELLNKGLVEDFLEATYIDGDLYDIRTGKDVF